MDDFNEVLEKIQTSAKEDITVDRKHLDTYLLTAGVMLQKYSKLLARFTRKYYDLEDKLSIKYKELFMFYKQDFDIQLKDAEIKVFISSDLEYINIKKSIDNHKVIIDLLERTIKDIQGNSWNIKSIIEYYKLTGEAI